MNTSIISDTLSDLSMPHFHTPDVSMPDIDIDTDAIVDWTRRMVPFFHQRSFVRRNMLSVGLVVAVAAVVAFFIVRRTRADESNVADFRVDNSMTRVA